MVKYLAAGVMIVVDIAFLVWLCYMLVRFVW